MVYPMLTGLLYAKRAGVHHKCSGISISRDTSGQNWTEPVLAESGDLLYPRSTRHAGFSWYRHLAPLFRHGADGRGLFPPGLRTLASRVFHRPRTPAGNCLRDVSHVTYLMSCIDHVTCLTACRRFRTWVWQ